LLTVELLTVELLTVVLVMVMVVLVTCCVRVMTPRCRVGGGAVTLEAVRKGLSYGFVAGWPAGPAEGPG
jgi:hypothetical protein